MSTAIPAAATRPKWYRWQPVTPAETLGYLLVMAVVSGLFSVLLNRIFTGAVAWDHFSSGAILSVFLNSLTLWLKRHRHHV